MKIVWLKGDYVGHHERQQQARDAKCNFVVSFHFNSFYDPKAGGCEIFYNNAMKLDMVKEWVKIAQELAQKLGVRWRSATFATGRANFINYYPCPAVLLEPMFVSNPEEAAKLHNLKFIRPIVEWLGQQIYEFAKRHWGNDAIIGLDIGHRYKRRIDLGAKCVGADYCWEANHNEQWAKIVASVIEQLDAKSQKEGDGNHEVAR